MSNLSRTLGALMREKQIRAAHLAKATGIDEATISRILNAQQKSITDDDLVRLCQAISSDKREQAQLIAARMADVQTGPAAGLIKLQIADQEPPAYLSETPVGQRPLPDKIEIALANIRKHILADDDLRDIILSLGNMYADNPAPKQTNYEIPKEKKMLKVRPPRSN